MIRFVDNTSVARGGAELQQEEEDLMIKCKREEREAGALPAWQDQVHMRESVLAHEYNLQHDVYTPKVHHIYWACVPIEPNS
jgi:hypothetical protein